MTFLMAITILCAIGCGDFDKKTDPVFVPYKQTFERITGHSLSGLPILFGDTHETTIFGKESSPDTIGLCQAYMIDGVWHDKHILIHRSTWDRMAESAREHLIFHEAIHCRLEVPDHTEYMIYYEGWEINHIMNAEIDHTHDLPLDVYRDQLKEYKK